MNDKNRLKGQSLQDKLNAKIDSASKKFNESNSIFKAINNFGYSIENSIKSFFDKLDIKTPEFPYEDLDDKPKIKTQKNWETYTKNQKSKDNLFFKDMKYRGNSKYGLIKILSPQTDNSNFIDDYKKLARENGQIDRNYLDSVPQENTKKIKSVSDRLDDFEKEGKTSYYSYSLFRLIEFDEPAKIERVIALVEKMESVIAKDYNEVTRESGSKPHLRDTWYVMAQWMLRYKKLFSHIDVWGEGDNRNLLKFLYYGAPATISYNLFYILTRLNIDVVVVTPYGYDYKNYAQPFYWDFIEKNLPIPSFEA